MNSKNILITSISSKVPLVKSVINSKNKFNESIKVYGADIKDTIIAKYFVDIFWIMPRISELNIDDFIDYCKKNNIAYIIPTRDADILFFAENKKILFQNNIFTFVSDYNSVLFCFDKIKFFQNSQDKSVIPTFNNLNMVDSSNIVVKERYGAGSNKIAINVSKDEAFSFARALDNPIFQPYIKGNEFSVDSYVNKHGKCLASIVRSRDLIIDGEAKVTTRVKDPILESKAKEFLEKNKILGHSVLQVIKSNSLYYIIECNARFGGASTLSYKLGLESFYWFLLECNNETIKPIISDTELKQIRISKDVYIEN
jgi:carbamoyl-phosphate synthase large subunit